MKKDEDDGEEGAEVGPRDPAAHHAFGHNFDPGNAEAGGAAQ